MSKISIVSNLTLSSQKLDNFRAIRNNFIFSGGGYSGQEPGPEPQKTAQKLINRLR